jgi:peroxiredoxin
MKMSGHSSEFKNAIRAATDQNGLSLYDSSVESPVLVVFLRHSGCTFCREALADIRRDRRRIESGGVRIALVHMTSDREAETFFGEYGLDDLSRFSDPDRSLYHSFGLTRGRLSQLLGLKTWWRALIAGLVNGHGLGRLRGDGRQMPGVFLIHNGNVIRSFRHKAAADRPDYETMAACPVKIAG